VSPWTFLPLLTWCCMTLDTGRWFCFWSQPNSQEEKKIFLLSASRLKLRLKYVGVYSMIGLACYEHCLSCNAYPNWWLDALCPQRHEFSKSSAEVLPLLKCEYHSKVHVLLIASSQKAFWSILKFFINLGSSLLEVTTKFGCSFSVPYGLP
jgi:hypothetical protein